MGGGDWKFLIAGLHGITINVTKEIKSDSANETGHSINLLFPSQVYPVVYKALLNFKNIALKSTLMLDIRWIIEISIFTHS